MLRFDHVTLHALRVEMTDGRQLLAVAPGRRFHLARARHRAASGGMLGGPRMSRRRCGQGHPGRCAPDRRRVPVGWRCPDGHRGLPVPIASSTLPRRSPPAELPALLSGDALPRELSWLPDGCRPTTTTRLPLASDSATCSAWSRHTMTVKNDASPFLRLDTASGRRPSHPPSCNGLGVVGEFPANVRWCRRSTARLPNAGQSSWG